MVGIAGAISLRADLTRAGAFRRTSRVGTAVVRILSILSRMNRDRVARGKCLLEGFVQSIVQGRGRWMCHGEAPRYEVGGIPPKLPDVTWRKRACAASSEG